MEATEFYSNLTPEQREAVRIKKIDLLKAMPAPISAEDIQLAFERALLQFGWVC
jgi:hypothetical protein